MGDDQHSHHFKQKDNPPRPAIPSGRRNFHPHDHPDQGRATNAAGRDLAEPGNIRRCEKNNARFVQEEHDV
ncbi:unnamed protein product, partial [Amoebophrya sp. A120]|eukprot:GSA120T00004469001.1